MAQSVAMNIFCNNVRAALDANDMTVTALAAATGIDRSNLSRILHGKEGITLDRAGIIAEAIGVSLSDLLSPKFKILKKSA